MKIKNSKLHQLLPTDFYFWLLTFEFIIMIVRLWHGKTSADKAEEYANYVMQTGIKDYRSTPGNLNAQLWQKTEGDITHIWTVSWWVNIESIKAFAGKNYEKAKYYKEDKKYLLELEPTVQHYEAFGEIR